MPLNMGFFSDLKVDLKLDCGNCLSSSVQDFRNTRLYLPTIRNNRLGVCAVCREKAETFVPERLGAQDVFWRNDLVGIQLYKSVPLKYKTNHTPNSSILCTQCGMSGNGVPLNITVKARATTSALFMYLRFHLHDTIVVYDCSF